MNEWMDDAKQKIMRGKQDAFVWYSIAARWFLLGNFLLYLAGCVVVGGLIGPVRYVEFLYHCSRFGQATQAAVVAPNSSAPIESPKRPPVLNPNASF
jgi:hypothetical protein